MNIFILHSDPEVAAKQHCDKHVCKMIVESAQMLSTAHRLLDGVETKRKSKSGKTTQNIGDLKTKKTKIYYIKLFIENTHVHYGQWSLLKTIIGIGNYLMLYAMSIFIDIIRFTNQINYYVADYCFHLKIYQLII